jgi:hypothetical protein
MTGFRANGRFAGFLNIRLGISAKADLVISHPIVWRLSELTRARSWPEFNRHGIGGLDTKYRSRFRQFQPLFKVGVSARKTRFSGEIRLKDGRLCCWTANGTHIGIVSFGSAPAPTRTAQLT